MMTGILFSLVATYRIEAANRRDYLVNLRETLRAKRLAEDNTTLAHLSTTDSLTGIANRRAFARELGVLGGQPGRPAFRRDVDRRRPLQALQRSLRTRRRRHMPA